MGAIHLFWVSLGVPDMKKFEDCCCKGWIKTVFARSDLAHGSLQQNSRKNVTKSLLVNAPESNFPF